MHPAKIQVSLRICVVWPESSLGVLWIVKDGKFLHADNEDSNQTLRMHILEGMFSHGDIHLVYILAPHMLRVPYSNQ